MARLRVSAMMPPLVTAYAVSYGVASVAAVDAVTGGPFLIDHDQKLQAQGALIWDIGSSGAWVGTNVRYDSGLVTDTSPDDLAGDPDNFFVPLTDRMELMGNARISDLEGEVGSVSRDARVRALPRLPGSS